jgi:hypothetical protein
MAFMRHERKRAAKAAFSEGAHLIHKELNYEQRNRCQRQLWFRRDRKR